MRKLIILLLVYLPMALPAENSIAAIVAATGNVVEVSAPTSVVHGAYESNTEIRAFNEPQIATLGSDITVNITSPGAYDDTATLTPATIPAGAVVCSHLLHVDPVGVNTNVVLEGTVSFDAEIIGVILLESDLDNSDGELGGAGVAYPIDNKRGVELDTNLDSVTLESDLRTLSLLFETKDRIDQIRVITAEPVRDLVISPPSGVYVFTQFFDIALIVEAPGLSVTGHTATFNGFNVTSGLAPCLIPGTLAIGGQTFRCPGLRGIMLGAGAHTFSVTVTLSDATTVSDTVIWNIKENTEP